MRAWRVSSDESGTFALRAVRFLFGLEVDDRRRRARAAASHRRPRFGRVAAGGAGTGVPTSASGVRRALVALACGAVRFCAGLRPCAAPGRAVAAGFLAVVGRLRRLGRRASRLPGHRFPGPGFLVGLAEPASWLRPLRGNSAAWRTTPGVWPPSSPACGRPRPREPAVLRERPGGRRARGPFHARGTCREGLRLGPGLRRAMRSPAPGIDSIPVSGLLLSAYRIER